ncbi:uncharacterized protein C8Q71DRAFT_909470 [Rhodofomes roseus]|uniref:Uncharacterized protein n=1 Tax=Rhodofomes roseus TaxID=34475 RepID=A0ABQ8K7Z6_9APHY|nr:uncharacterized protein C8Q71DRAFT_909470 [Rhodofomes roseus]KAH9833423.1 hypothetical protein C8Q71DRAFT_909470 [Rhodofomes roseus]
MCSPGSAERRRPRQQRQLRREQLQLRRGLPVQAHRVQVLNAVGPVAPASLARAASLLRRGEGRESGCLVAACNGLAAMGATPRRGIRICCKIDRVRMGRCSVP